MLDPDDVDLDELAEALDDHSADVSYGHSRWLDPTSGELRFHSADLGDETPDDLDEAGLIYIEALPSSVGYGDMEDFIEDVRDRRARDLLARAIAGRGAFRRFKDRPMPSPTSTLSSCSTGTSSHGPSTGGWRGHCGATRSRRARWSAPCPSHESVSTHRTNRRAQADYSTDPVPAEEADRSIVDAEVVVALVETWLDGPT